MDGMISRSAKMADMWKGSLEPEKFNHRCPFRMNGVSEAQCIELSGSNLQQNLNACCGTERAGVMFDPCNSKARRCRVCLERGLRGKSAQPVTDPIKGMCALHSRAPVDLRGEITESSERLHALHEAGERRQRQIEELTSASSQAGPIDEPPKRPKRVPPEIITTAAQDLLVQAAIPMVPTLSRRRHQMLSCLAEDLSRTQIAERLGVTQSNVEVTLITVSHIFKWPRMEARVREQLLTLVARAAFPQEQK